MLDNLTTREQLIVGHVTQTFREMSVVATLVDVHKLEGGMASTLRVTANDTASADLERQRIEDTSESVESLAQEMEAKLRTQLVS